MNSGVVAFANGDVDWPDDTIKVLALSSAFTFDPDLATLDQVLAGILDEVTLAGKAVTATGQLDADDGSFTAVPSGQTITGLMVYKATGVEATSPLLMWMDTNEDGTPISRTSDGSAIPLNWSATADAIARL